MAAMNEWSPPLIDGVSLRTRAPSDVVPCDCGIRIGESINRIRPPDRFDGRSLCDELASGSCSRDVVQTDMLKLKAKLTLARNCCKLKGAAQLTTLFHTLIWAHAAGNQGTRALCGQLAQQRASQLDSESERGAS